MSGRQSSTNLDREFRAVVWLVVVMAIGIVMLGCNSEPPTAVARPDQPKITPTAATQVLSENKTEAGIAPAELLVGTWLGGAYIDQEQVAQLLESLDETERLAVIKQVENFMTTVMAIDFRRDGSMENEIELTPAGGKPLRDSSVGSWRIVEFDEQRVVIETTEKLPNGSVDTSKKICRLYDDGDHFAIQVPLSEKLMKCNPLIIFERQEMGPTAMAEIGGRTQTK